MIFKPYYYFETGCAGYLFGCGGLGKCAVVDAHEEDVDAYIAFAASKGLRITHVIDTHIHADHRSGGPALARKVGAGAGMSGKPSSTIAFEKRWNPLLSKSREEFVDALADVPPKPAAMEYILRKNQGRA